MDDILKNNSWKNGIIPDNTNVYCIGDVHGEHLLLDRLLHFIKKKIESKPKGLKVRIVFVGDYIDRGLNSKKTIDKLIEYDNSFKENNETNVHFLCGNHDEFFNKIMICNGICSDPINNLDFEKDPLQKLILNPQKKIYIRGLRAWFNVGGGKSTIIDYCPEIYNNLDFLLNKTFKNTIEQMTEVNSLIKKLKDSVPNNHKEFFSKIFINRYIIIGDYLFTHAGVNPFISLKKQGITENNNHKNKLSEYMNLELMMIRDVFLWRDDLRNCKYYLDY